MGKILLIHKGQFDNFPPLLSVKTALNSLGYNVDVLTTKVNNYSFFNIQENCYVISRTQKIPILNNIIWYIKYYFKLHRLLKMEYDFFWFEGGDTVALFGWSIKAKKNYIFQMSELYDKIPIYKYFIGKSIKKFDKIIVPEINRAYIIKVWYDLEKIPYILPNKPNYSLPAKSNQINEDLQSKIKMIMEFAGNRRIILYQGIIANDRKFGGVVQFVKNNPNYCLVLIGNDAGYLKEINIDTKNILYAGFLMPPLHIEITKLAHICLMTYNTTSLNKVYCAPNKIWEYTMQGKPIISQKLPGVEFIITKFLIGSCCDIENEQDVSKSIDYIESHYQEMVQNTQMFYNSFDFNQKVREILQ